MRTEAEVRKRLKYYERRCKRAIRERSGVFWWALKHVAEEEWANWFLRKRRVPEDKAKAGQ